jgi:hypothetical protein
VQVLASEEEKTINDPKEAPVTVRIIKVHDRWSMPTAHDASGVMVSVRVAVGDVSHVCQLRLGYAVMDGIRDNCGHRVNATLDMAEALIAAAGAEVVEPPLTPLWESLATDGAEEDRCRSFWTGISSIGAKAAAPAARARGASGMQVTFSALMRGAGLAIAVPADDLQWGYKIYKKPREMRHNRRRTGRGPLDFVTLQYFKRHILLGGFECTVRVFRHKFTLEDANGSHACSLEASRRVTNGIPLGCPLFLPVGIVNFVQTLKGCVGSLLVGTNIQLLARSQSS